ncbi:steroid 17-alpha-hydroxylase/17,20 lyase isoform X2 [Nematostella vectensis]|nr:steroid 17-alpha-hydroxylase/17,20 lyase isoform X2 [Nematostella vectensis]XP_032219239.1 steroid 17-alpha-hydroxylase/17,20 lyase isoform X2 [Nematostella vectensis]
MLVEGAVFAVGLTLLIAVVMRKKQDANLPPGPPPLPLLGNMLDIWGSMPNIHLGFSKLAKHYGDIYTLYLQGNRVVVVGSAAIAREALVLRKDDFSGRPYSFIGDFFTRGCKDLAMADLSPTLKWQRKLVHTALRLYSPRLEGQVCEEVDGLIKRLKAANGNPIDPKHDLFLTILNVICNMVFGSCYSMNDPEFLQVVHYNQLGFRLLSPVSLVNIFPWLLKLPTQQARDFYYVRDVQGKILDQKFSQHKATFNSSNIRDFTDALLKARLEAVQENEAVHHMITEDHLIMTIADVFSAGAETMTTTLRWFIACLVNFPDVQKKIQNELDCVVGRHRLPTLEDRERLDYLEAVITEVHRYCTVTHLSLPHKATCDSHLHGYSIPKDTVIMFNVWQMHHDERYWDQPYRFDPTRFLDAKGKLVDVAGIKSFLPFSAGRRVCSGESLAKKELFLVTSRLLHQLTFTSPPGYPVPDLEGEVGMNHFPRPFEVCVNERY